MIVDFFIALFAPLVEGAADVLPAGSAVTIPGVDQLVLWIGRLDSFVPIAGPLAFALGLLSMLALFVAVRLVLLVITTVKP